jgi:hypothetical protein
VRTIRPAAVRAAGVVLALSGLAGLAGCSGDGTAGEPAADDTAATGAAGSPSQSPGASASVVFDQALHDELVQMQADDQAEMTGQGADPTTTVDERQARLAEILDKHGWPGWDLVGKKGSTAAWVIAQHADLDPGLQARALDLLEEAVADGNASSGDLAYLTDRVAVARGEDQTYGTQIRCAGEKPVPATPIADEAGVEQRRKDAGLPSLESYIVEMRQLCSNANG